MVWQLLIALRTCKQVGKLQVRKLASIEFTSSILIFFLTLFCHFNFSHNMYKKSLLICYLAIVTNDRSHEVYVSINNPRYAYVIVKVVLLWFIIGQYCFLPVSAFIHTRNVTSQTQCKWLELNLDLLLLVWQSFG